MVPCGSGGVPGLEASAASGGPHPAMAGSLGPHGARGRAAAVTAVRRLRGGFLPALDGKIYGKHMQNIWQDSHILLFLR